MSLLGNYTYKVDEQFSQPVLKYITQNRLPAAGIVRKGGFLYFSFPAELKRDMDRKLAELHAVHETVGIRGTVRFAKMLAAKKGMLIGCLVSAILLFVLSDIIFSFEVLCDDNKIRSDVMAVLYQDGIRAGCSQKDINFTEAERDIKKKVEGLSWAGISVQGSKVIVDVIKNIEKPEFTQKRLPTNLIAGENGVIEKIELTDGLLMKPIGSGVTKGDLLVSGDVISDLSYSRKGYVKHFYVHYYTRSIGKIYGTFERRETFFQPYSITQKALKGEPVRKSFLSLFDVDIPLFFNAEEESIISPYSEEHLTFFGAELPIGIKTTKLTEYEISQKPITEQQARDYARKLAKEYETNFLDDYKIKNKAYRFETKPEGVYLTAEYKLYGVISKEVDFFISK